MAGVLFVNTAHFVIAILDNALTVEEVLPGVDVRPNEGVRSLSRYVADL